MQNFPCRFMNNFGYVIAVKFREILIKWIFIFLLYMTEIFATDVLDKSAEVKIWALP